MKVILVFSIFALYVIIIMIKNIMGLSENRAKIFG